MPELTIASSSTASIIPLIVKRVNLLGWLVVRQFNVLATVFTRERAPKTAGHSRRYIRTLIRLTHYRLTIITTVQMGSTRTAVTLYCGVPTNRSRRPEIT